MACALRTAGAALAGLVAGWGCGSSPAAASKQIVGEELDAAQDAAIESTASTPAEDALGPVADTAPEPVGASNGDGEAGGLPADRFVTGVVSFDPGPCAGFGASSMPGIVEGPPVGGGTNRGSTDVVSLGHAGSIVVSFAPDGIVDGPGADFIVFENPFWVGGNPNEVFAEPGEVSVSDDGTSWQTYPCNPTPDPTSALGTGVAGPYGQCAGWHVVYSSPQNGISPVDPSMSGGDPFDLADLGVHHARYVRIVDKTEEACPEAGPRPNDNGFDLDAVSIVNADMP